MKIYQSTYPSVILACSIGSSLVCNNAFAMINTYGATGLYNIPNADTTAFGDFYFRFNNNIEVVDKKTPGTTGSNQTANLGVYPNLELNLRLHEVLDKSIHKENIYGDFYKRDLSGNLKFKLPFISNKTTRFAVGMTDIGGLAVNFRRVYAAGSYRFRNIDLTTGYSMIPSGQRDNNILKGLFYGIEYKPFNWLGISAEKESSGSRAGSQLIWNNPVGWSGKITAGYIFYDSSAENSFSLGLSVPIGGATAGSDFIERQNASKLTDLSSVIAQNKKNRMSVKPPVADDSIDSDRKNLSIDEHELQNRQAQTLRNALEDVGLDFVQIGFSDKTLVVAYQNRLFNWNQTHAIAAALQQIGGSELLKKFDNLELITLNNNTPVLKTTIKKSQLIELSENPKSVSTGKASVWLKFKNTSSHPSATWLVEPRVNSKVDINLTLAYKAYYGTEWANWDYSMALRPIIRVPLWQGAHISNVYHIGTQNSYGFTEGVFKQKAFADQLNELMIHQTVQPLTGLVNTLSYGELKFGNEPFRGFMNQGEYQLLDGYSRIYWRQGSMKAESQGLELSYNAIGAELNWPQTNLVAGYQTGRYIEDDTSNIVYGRIKLGNAIVGVGLTTSNIKWKRIDMSIAFPLGPEKNSAIGPVTLGGDPMWSTGMGTVIDNPILPGANLIDINPGYKLVGAALVNSYSQTQSIYDNGRLTPAYLETHIKQLLDGFSSH